MLLEFYIFSFSHFPCFLGMLENGACISAKGSLILCYAQRDPGSDTSVALGLGLLGSSQ